MRKTLTFIAAVLLLLLSAVSVKAGRSESSKIVTLPSDEVVEKDYFATGDIIEIYGTVNGDVYAAGGQIIIDGTINGDLLVAGGTINISGSVAQDARVVGGQITITGTVDRNLTVVGGNVELTDSANIAGNSVIGAGNVNLASTVNGNVVVGAGNLTISNGVGGDVEAGVGTLRLTSNAEVGGDLTYWSNEEAQIDEAAAVAGAVTKKKPPEELAATMEKEKKTKGIFAAARSINFFASLLVGLLLIHFYPKYSTQAAATIRKRPWPSLGLGFGALVLTPIALFFIGITIIGIPVALILLAGYLIYLYLANIFVALWAGTIVTERAKRKMSLGWTFVLGLIIYYLATLIPGIGWMARFFALLFGLGAMLITCKEVYLTAKKKEII